MAPERTRLIFVRHGESVVTVDRVIGGEKSDSGLSELGQRQAKALARRLAAGNEPRIDAVVSSTLPRARETAEAVVPALDGVELTFDPDLVELRPGEADGLSFDDYAMQYELRDLRAHPFSPIAPGGESLASFHYRAAAAVWRIVEEFAGRTAMVVCHGGVIDVAFRSLLELPMAARFNLWTVNTSLTELSRGEAGGPWALVRYNDAAHLDRTGAPLD